MKIITSFRLLACMLFCALVFSACSTDKIPDAEIPKAANEFAANYIHKLFVGDSTYCLDNVNAAIPDSLRTAIVMATRIFPTLQTNSARLVTAVQDGDGTSFIQYEYALPKVYMYVGLLLSKENNSFKVISFSANAYNEPLSKSNAFTLAHKSTFQYFFLFGGILLWLFKIVTVIVIIRSALPKPKKIAWICSVALGIGEFTMNWTTGVVFSKFFSLDITGFRVVKHGLVSPWLVTISVPLWLIIFWAKRKTIMNGEKVGELTPDQRIEESYRKLSEARPEELKELN